MSSPKRRILLSDRATRDLQEIWIHGAEEWGEQQADRNGGRHKRAIRSLASFPHLGRLRQDVALELRSLTVRRHVIVYRVETDIVRVFRIVRSSIELGTSALDEEA